MRSQRTGSGLRFKPSFESLEDRSLPSGNVQAAVFGGVLTVVGDDSANAIWIAGAGKNTVVIRSTDTTTTINGHSVVVLKGVTHGYNVQLKGGDDNLLLMNTVSNGGVSVDMGDGNDVMNVQGAGHRGATTILGGNGNDTITLSAAAFRSYVFVDAGAGDDNVIADHISVGALGLMNPAGSDFFDNRGSMILHPALTGFASGARPPAPAPAPSPTDSSSLNSMPAPPTTSGTPLTPVATITTSATNPTNASSAPFTVSFNEDVQFAQSGVSVTGGSLSNFTQVDAHTYTFTVTPAADGQVTVTVNAGTARDKAGATNAAASSSLVFSQTPPSFTASNPPTVAFNAGAQSLTNFATFTPAPAGGTTPTYTISAVSNPGLFSVQPTVAPNGALSFTPVTGGFGSSTFAVSVSDGLNSSATQTFTITVDPVTGVSPTTVPGTTISLSNSGWAVVPTVVPASNSAGIPAGTVADGTRILDETVGTGTAVASGDVVNVTFTGYLLDGTIFNPTTTAPFTVDPTSVIPGFAAGLIGMQVGGTRDIDISSYLAYGSPGHGTVPANSRLVFQVTLNSIM